MARNLLLLICFVCLVGIFSPSQSSALVIYNFRTTSQTIIDTPCEFYGADYCGYGNFHGVNGQLIFSDGVKKQGNHVFSLDLPGYLLGFYFEGFDQLSFDTYWGGNGFPDGGPFLFGTIANGHMLALSAQFSHGAWDGGYSISAAANEVTCTIINPLIHISAQGVWEVSYLPVPEPETFVLLAIGIIIAAPFRRARPPK